MPINIQSLFSDIIETPAQRQQRMLTEGILKGRELTGGLTGLARTQAPLVSALAMQMPQRQEALRRGVGGMLGLDVRTESEKLADIIKTADASTPAGMINLSKAIQEYAPTQALTLRQAAIEEQRDLSEAARQKARQEAADIRAERQLELSEQAGARSQATFIQSMYDSAKRREREETAFEQGLEDRRANQQRAEELSEALPAESPFQPLLKGSNVSGSILSAAAESLVPDTDIRLVDTLDATGQRVIQAIDLNSNTVRSEFPHPDQGVVKRLTNEQEERLIDEINEDPILSKIVEPGGWLTPRGVSTESSLASMINQLEQTYKLNRQQAIEAIKDTYQSPNGKEMIRAGRVSVGDYQGETGTQDETSVFSEADAILGGQTLSLTTSDPNFRMVGVQDAPSEERPVGMDDQIERMISFNQRMNAKPETIESSVSNILNVRKAELERLETALESQNKMKDFPGFGDEQFIAQLESQIKSLRDTINYYENPLELIASR
jgi:hypothetical protein